jgi:hypothetical protein
VEVRGGRGGVEARSGSLQVTQVPPPPVFPHPSPTRSMNARAQSVSGLRIYYYYDLRGNGGSTIKVPPSPVFLMPSRTVEELSSPSPPSLPLCRQGRWKSYQVPPPSAVKDREGRKNKTERGGGTRQRGLEEQGQRGEDRRGQNRQGRLGV